MIEKLAVVSLWFLIILFVYAKHLWEKALVTDGNNEVYIGKNNSFTLLPIPLKESDFQNEISKVMIRRRHKILLIIYIELPIVFFLFFYGIEDFK